MDPLTVSTDVTEALGGLIDDEQELAAAAIEAREGIEAKLECLREPFNPASGREIKDCERLLRRVRILAETRKRASDALRSGSAGLKETVRFLRAVLQEGTCLGALDEDLRVEIPTETLDRYATAFQRVTGRPFDPAADSITWREVAT